ncbi:MAG: protein kinase [Kofleriaceae bacterium]|nr:protein kinase [Kofleriaceae bacterium]
MKPGADTEPVAPLVGAYEIVARIAAGGMAQIELGRVVGPYGFTRYAVIKQPLPHLAGDPTIRRMFRDEAVTGGMLYHPGVVGVVDASIGDPDLPDFVALEYVHGMSLRQLMHPVTADQVAPIDLAAALAIVVDVAAALHYVHELRDGDGAPLGLIHRDVTPGNVLLGYDGAVKLTDFGVVRRAAHNTLSGSLRGTITYMAPEQCQGQVIDRRADVFSLGVILYELVTGQRLFHADNEVASLHKVVSGTVPRPRQLRPDLDPDLEAIILGALAHDAPSRYPDAETLGGLLLRWAARHHVHLGGDLVAKALARVGPPTDPWRPHDLAPALTPEVRQRRSEVLPVELDSYTTEAEEVFDDPTMADVTALEDTSRGSPDWWSAFLEKWDGDSTTRGALRITAASPAAGAVREDSVTTIAAVAPRARASSRPGSVTAPARTRPSAPPVDPGSRITNDVPTVAVPMVPPPEARRTAPAVAASPAVDDKLTSPYPVVSRAEIQARTLRSSAPPPPGVGTTPPAGAAAAPYPGPPSSAGSAPVMTPGAPLHPPPAWYAERPSEPVFPETSIVAPLPRLAHEPRRAPARGRVATGWFLAGALVIGVGIAAGIYLAGPGPTPAPAPSSAGAGATGLGAAATADAAPERRDAIDASPVGVGAEPGAGPDAGGDTGEPLIEIEPMPVRPDRVRPRDRDRVDANVGAVTPPPPDARTSPRPDARVGDPTEWRPDIFLPGDSSPPRSR